MTEFTTILRVETGSAAYGTATEFSDRDYIEVAVEPRSYITGLDRADVQHSSTAGNERSGAGDADVTRYGLQRFATLAAAGNPNVLETLFIKPEYADAEGRYLLANRHRFVSRQAGERYLGYMRSQRYAMTGYKNKRTSRPELIDQFGYDTKFAYHMVRLGLMGIELMTHGALSMPMGAGDVKTLMKVRRGEFDKADVLDIAADLEEELKAATKESDLRDSPNRKGISGIMHEIYMEEWGEWE